MAGDDRPRAAGRLAALPQPHTVGQLIDSGHLVAEERRHFRYVTLASLFAYQRRR
ncbi:hypothetical protein ABT124_50880 [Streptomyces sp. NPDC001982]|uniref:hypothetical protein n=1 Tax=unclassified Streptomyces TaxID=2593676 RepID=UPI00332A4D9D